MDVLVKIRAYGDVSTPYEAWTSATTVACFEVPLLDSPDVARLAEEIEERFIEVAAPIDGWRLDTNIRRWEWGAGDLSAEIILLIAAPIVAKVVDELWDYLKARYQAQKIEERDEDSEEDSEDNDS
jgi:hypothetical protein